MRKSSKLNQLQKPLHQSRRRAKTKNKKKTEEKKEKLLKEIIGDAIDDTLVVADGKVKMDLAIQKKLYFGIFNSKSMDLTMRILYAILLILFGTYATNEYLATRKKVKDDNRGREKQPEAEASKNISTTEVDRDKDKIHQQQSQQDASHKQAQEIKESKSALTLKSSSVLPDDSTSESEILVSHKQVDSQNQDNPKKYRQENETPVNQKTLAPSYLKKWNFNPLPKNTSKFGQVTSSLNSSYKFERERVEEEDASILLQPTNTSAASAFSVEDDDMSKTFVPYNNHLPQPTNASSASAANNTVKMSKTFVHYSPPSIMSLGDRIDSFPTNETHSVQEPLKSDRFQKQEIKQNQTSTHESLLSPSTNKSASSANNYVVKKQEEGSLYHFLWKCDLKYVMTVVSILISMLLFRFRTYMNPMKIVQKVKNLMKRLTHASIRQPEMEIDNVEREKTVPINQYPPYAKELKNIISELDLFLGKTISQSVSQGSSFTEDLVSRSEHMQASQVHRESPSKVSKIMAASNEKPKNTISMSERQFLTLSDQ